MDVPCFVAAGDHFAQGRALGLQQRERIARFLNDGLCRLEYLMDDKPSAARIRDETTRHGDAIARHAPEIHALLRGLASGAGIDLEQALLLQLRREIVGYYRVPTLGECTSFVVPFAGGLCGAQTIDLNGCMQDHMCVVRYEGPRSRRILMLTYTGLAGFLGMNSDGLGVLINLVIGGTWSPGVPPYLVVRALLDQPDVDSALERALALPFASSRSLTLFDRRQHVTLEVCGERKVAKRRPHALHTNHFLAAELVPHDAVNIFARNDSVKRYDACEKRLASYDGADTEVVFSLLAEAPICVHSRTENHRSDRTVAAAVLEVTGGRLHVRRGYPCESATVTFDITADRGASADAVRAAAP